MFGRRNAGQVAAIDARLHAIEERLGRIELMFMMKDPDAGASAGAFDQLRRLVGIAVRDRDEWLARFAEIDRAIRADESRADLEMLSSHLLTQADVERVIDLSRTEVFEPLGDGSVAGEVVSPAYVDRRTGRTVVLGRARPTEAAGAAVAARGDRENPVERNEANEVAS